MKKLAVLMLISIVTFSCNSDNNDYEKVRSISEEWVKKNIFPLYNSPVLEHIERNDKTYRKILFDGTFNIVEDESYDFEPYSKQSIFELKKNRLNIYGIDNVDSLWIDTIHHLEQLTDIEERIYKSSNYAIKIIADKNPPFYYLCRISIIFKDDTAKVYNLDGVLIDVILDDKMNVLNKL